MNRFKALIVFVPLAVVFTLLCTGDRADATPLLQLPWPTGSQHNITVGYTYSRPGQPCGDHTGVDYYAIDFQFSLDDPISSVAGGTVLVIQTDPDQSGYGIYIDVDHGAGFVSRYAHMDYPASGLVVGAHISQGQVVGYADSTGHSTGNHLHFRLTRNGNAYEPEPMTGVTGFGQWGSCWTTQYPSSWTSSPPQVLNLVQNRSFEDTTSCDGSAFKWQKYPTPPVTCAIFTCCSPAHGTRFLTMKGNAGASIYQDVFNVSPGPGDSYAFSVWVRSVDAGCVPFTLALFGLGSAPEWQQTHTQVCGTTWQLFSAPLDVTHADNTYLRAQIYLDQSDRWLDVDAAELIQLMTRNSSFESPNGFGTSDWNRIHPSGGTTNWNRQCTPAISNPSSGPCLLTVSRSGGTGASSVYEDIWTIPKYPESYTAWVDLRLGTGAQGPISGSVVLWALPSSPICNTTANFTLTSAEWIRVPVTLTACVGTRTNLRIEVYINNANKNYDIDAVKVWKN
jgi:hypothetical protein